MNSSRKIQELKTLPYILIRDNCIVEAGDSFFALTKYKKIDILDKEITFVFKNLLRCDMSLGAVTRKQKDIFIFTSELEPVEVEVNIHSYKNQKVVIFKDKPLSTINQGFLYIQQHLRYTILGVAILQAESLILLKANHTFFSFLEEPYNRPENSIGRSLNEICTGWTGSAAHKEWLKVIDSGEPLSHKEFLFEGFKRGITYWDVTVMPVYENRKIRYLVQTLNDVTETVTNRKLIEEQNSILKQQAEQLQLNVNRIEEQAKTISTQKQQLETIMENMTEALFVLDKGGRYILINKAGRERIGVSLERIGDSCSHVEFFDMEGNRVPLEETANYQVLQGIPVSDKVILMKTPFNQMYVNINGAPIFDEKGDLLYGVIISRDVTEKVKHEQEIIKKNRQLEAIIDNIDDAVFIFDKDNNHYLQNKAAREYFPDRKLKKLGDAQINTKYFDMDNKEIPKEGLTISRVLKGEIVKNDRMKMVLGATTRYLSVNGRQVYDDNGEICFSLLLSKDITDQVEREERIKQQQELILKAERTEKQILENAIKMKDEFLTTITHEFKTPITVINAALQTIESLYDSQVSDNLKKHLQTIRTNSYRQLRLVNNLLDITKYNAGHFKVNKRNLDIVFLTNAIINSVYPYARQKGVELRFTTNVECKVMAIDEEKYERILLNLLSNAIKFTPKEKSIYIDITCKNRKAVLSIKDEGVGIPQNKQKVIFERFGQADCSLSRQAEGTGIGLSLVKTLVEGMGGTITVASKVGTGSTFTVILPITKLRNKKSETGSLNLQDNRVMQSAAIEFSDIYME